MEEINLTIEDCVDDALQAWVDERCSLEELRDFHRQVSALSRQAYTELDFRGDKDAIRFMHQVADGALKKLRHADRRIGLRNMRKRSHV